MWKRCSLDDIQENASMIGASHAVAGHGSEARDCVMLPYYLRLQPACTVSAAEPSSYFVFFGEGMVTFNGTFLWNFRIVLFDNMSLVVPLKEFPYVKVARSSSSPMSSATLA